MNFTDKVSIICPTYNNEEYTIRCFNSIYKNTDNYVLIWVDNNSNVESINSVFPLFKKHKLKFFMRNENNDGFVKAVNKGVKKSLELGCNETCIINNDIEVYKGWIDNFRRVLHSDDEIACVGGISTAPHQWQYYDKIFDLVGVKKPFEMCDDFKKLSSKLNEIDFISRKVSGVAFFCSLFYSSIFKEIGLLGEEYGVGLGDDVDYCKRIKDSGKCCALSLNTLIYHNHRTTFKKIYSNDEIDEIKNKHKKILKDKFNSNDFIEWKYE